MRVLISGCGYVGTALGHELVKSGHEAWGLRRDRLALGHIEKLGIKPIRANLLKPEEFPNLPMIDTLVICQAPSHKNDDYRNTYLAGTKALLSRFSKGELRRIILIGSTSVYSTSDGSWVDEKTEPLAGPHADAESHENAKILLAQEEVVLKSPHPAVILRLAGIYGPGRNRVKAVLEGRLQPSLSDQIMNRIHLQDIVRAIRLLIDKGSSGEIYLGADDAPCTQKEFYSWLLEKLGLPSAVETPLPIPTHGSNKRCRNDKLKSLGFKFRFPTYREGYEPLIREALEATQKDQGAQGPHWLSR